MTVKDLYCQYYFEAIDAVISCIKDRFDQPGYITYKSSEELLLKAAKQEDYTSEIEAVSKFYQKNLDQELLKTNSLRLGKLSLQTQACLQYMTFRNTLKV